MNESTTLTSFDAYSLHVTRTEWSFPSRNALCHAEKEVGGLLIAWVDVNLHAYRLRFRIFGSEKRTFKVEIITTHRHNDHEQAFQTNFSINNHVDVNTRK